MNTIKLIEGVLNQQILNNTNPAPNPNEVEDNLNKEDIKLVEASDDEDTLDNPEIDPIDEEPNDSEESSDLEDIMSNTDEDAPDFITSESLNELREVLLDIKDDIHLLLLDADVIVLAEITEGKTYLYTLPSEDTSEFVKIEMPNTLEDIMGNDSIIKYTPDEVDSRHQKVMDILMGNLNEDEPEETIDDIEEEVEDENKD